MSEAENDARLVVAVVHDKDADELEAGLNEARYQVTRLKSSGGFLKEGNTTFFIGTDKEYVDELLEVIENNCRCRKKTIAPMSPLATELESYYSLPMEVEIGGATVFVLDVEQFKKI